ncbi:MAG: hypothetical protein HQK52_22945 [Oligoflexia bacterium]|nr:hypothetical protein [Oligoflexia bacterium]
MLPNNFKIFCGLLITSFYLLGFNHALAVKADDQSQWVYAENKSPMVKSTLELAEKSFSQTALCEDYHLAISLLKQVQAQDPHQSEKYEILNQSFACPTTYHQFARKLHRLIEQLGDFHVLFSHPKKNNLKYLNGYLPAVVIDCQGKDPSLCQDSIGWVLHPMPSEVTDQKHPQSYAIIGSASGKIRALQILGITQSHRFYNPQEIITISVNDKIIAPTENASLIDSLFPWLTRSSLASESELNDVKVQVKDLKTEEEAEATLSFKQENFSSLDRGSYFYTYAKSIFIQRRNYDCASIQPHSKDPMKGNGICKTKSGEALAWMSTFSYPDSEGLSPVTLFTQFFRENPETLTRPIILDLRGNNGGSPKLAVEMACAFGDENTFDRIKNRSLQVSYWPQSFQLDSGRVYLTKDLTLEGANADLIKIKESWNSVTLREQNRYHYPLSMLSRVLISEEECRQLKIHFNHTLEWRVLTSGKEASAAELFLSLINKSKSLFEISGRSSFGASGHPISVILPNTKSILKISLARQVAGDATGTEYDPINIIQGIGVQPDHTMVIEEVSDWEKAFANWCDQSIVGKPYVFDVLKSSNSPFIIRHLKIEEESTHPKQ